MTDEEVKEELRKNLQNYVESITHKSRSGGYICPLCHSGTGKNKTGAFYLTDDKKHWTCFSCNALQDKGRDIFDLIGEVEHIKDFKDQLKRVKELYHMEDTGNQKQPQITQKPATAATSSAAPAQEKEEEADYTDLFLQAYGNINKTDYPEKRGLSVSVINRFQLGYIENWKHPKAPGAPASPRLIIPTSPSSYLARDVRPAEKLNPEEEKRCKMKVGAMHFLNADALELSTKPIFIVEGEIDALSIMTMQGEAIALGSTVMVGKFLELLKTTPPSQPLILALDNDERGKEAQDRLAIGLQELGIEHYKGNVSGDYKDPNEFLIKDAVAFAEAVDKAEKQPQEEYIKTSAAHTVAQFMEDISIDTPFIPTGFTELDENLDGGLFEGLYIFGAITSLGKTTFIMQIADQIARAGNDVLIFSLEMSKYELIAKSLSRLTYTLAMQRWGKQNNAKTVRGITTRSRWEKYSADEIGLVNYAADVYKKFGEHIFISEGIGDIGAQQIRQKVERHIKITRRRPVVVIDYLQILAPWNVRATDKQNTDKAVLELKRLSRDYKLPIIGISSFNRDNYNEPVSHKSFKESGAIEYSSDVLIGLQLRGVGNPMFSVDQAMLEDPREIELVVLKNRNGGPRARVLYEYKTLFNHFKEIGTRKAAGRKWTKIGDAEIKPAFNRPPKNRLKFLNTDPNEDPDTLKEITREDPNETSEE